MQPIFFVYLKATEGATVKDETYIKRAVQADRHGIAKGAYHFLHLVFPQKSKVPSPKIEVLQFIKRNVLVPCGRETQNADF